MSAARLYPEVAFDLHDAGYSPLPVPPRQKKEPVRGWTGGAPMLSYADVHALADDPKYREHNTAARLPEHVIGLDVDDYDGKPGAATWRKLHGILGPPPATVVVSSRDDGSQSGIRLYRVPEGRSQQELGTGLPGIEILRHGHRYVMAPGSIHPEDRVYRVWRSDTGELLDQLPPVDTLPLLPVAWFDAFTKAKSNGDGAATHRAFTAGLPCQAVAAALSDTETELGSGRSRHDVTAAGVGRLVRLGDQGHAGVKRAVNELRVTWLDAVDAPRDGGLTRTPAQARQEFTDLMESAVALVDAKPTVDASRRCCGPATEANGDVASHYAAVTLADVAPEQVSWLWPGRIPAGKLTVFDGDPSLGKSTVALDIAAKVTTGTVFYDGTRPPVGGVLLLSGEDGLADTVRPRLDAAGADPSRVHALTGIRLPTEDGGYVERDPHLGDVAEIEHAVRDHDVRLVIVDVLAAFLPSGTDSHKDTDVRQVLRRLKDLAEHTGAAIIALRHLNKSGGATAIYRGGGSIGIVGAARAGYLFARDPDDENRVILAATKLNVATMPTSCAYRLVDHGNGAARVDWLGNTGHRADDLTHAPDPDREESQSVAAFLRELLADHGGEMSHKDAAKAVRSEFGAMSDSALKRAKVRAGIRSRKGGMSAGWVWYLPEGTAEGSEGTASENPGPFGPFVDPSQANGTPANGSKPPCGVCGDPLDPTLIELGWDTHVGCEAAS